MDVASWGSEHVVRESTPSQWLAVTYVAGRDSQHRAGPSRKVKMSSNVSIDSVGNLISADRVTRLAPGEIFVFGSNAKGKHGSGAARDAMDLFGAVYAQGHGLHGSSYAIDTMSGASVLAAEITGFLNYAAAHPEQTFLVTRIGCGIAGYTPAQMGTHFASSPSNVALPRSFVAAGARTRAVSLGSILIEGDLLE